MNVDALVLWVMLCAHNGEGHERIGGIDRDGGGGDKKGGSGYWR